MRLNVLTKWFGVMAVTLVIPVAFQNCSDMTATQTEDIASVVNLTCDEDCITPTLADLEVKAHLGGSGTEYSVPTNLIEFNIGGNCNEGGYAYNTIRWELFLNGVKRRDSGMLGMAGANPVNSRCVNGRYLLYINLRAITEDNVNRTGLGTGVNQPRAPYDLYIEIYGQDSPTDMAPKRNPTKGRIRVSLLPI